ncbi:MAG: toxin-activating lysine-acyltransferase, partial [Curvibacter sp.]
LGGEDPPVGQRLQSLIGAAAEAGAAANCPPPSTGKLFFSGLQPVAYLSWAHLSAEAESRYLDHPLRGLQPADWRSGDRMWAIDWITPFGHAHALRASILRLLPQVCFRFLYHRGNERGLRIKTYRGRAITAEQARQWWLARPMLAATQAGTPAHDLLHRSQAIQKEGKPA